MNESRPDLRKILQSANLLLRDVIADLDLALNTPTQEWTINSRQRTMEALSLKAGNAAEIFGNWIQQNVPIKNIAKICGCLDSIRDQAHQTQFAKSRTCGRAHLRPDLPILIDLLGEGCELEPDVPAYELPESLDVVQPTSQLAKAKSSVDPSERP